MDALRRWVGVRTFRSTIGFGRALIYVSILLAALPVVSAGVRYSGSDAKGVTVVAQELLDHGTISLSEKEAEFFSGKRGLADYRTIRLNGSLEYYFPLGPVMLVLPFVAVENALGIHATDRKADWKLQQKLVVVASALIIYLLYRLGLSILRPSRSLLLAVGFFYGTLLAPTVGGAFWSIDTEIVFTGLTVLLLWDDATSISKRRSLALGLLLFSGFLCRPTFASIILCVFAYLALHDRRALAYSALVSATLLTAFIVFSELHYGTYLPPYYLASRLSCEHLAAALWGLTISPSRGLLVFCPIFIVLLAFVPFIRRSRNPLLLFSLSIAMLLQFASNLVFPHWSGGSSFGPRILATCIFIGCVLTIGLLGGMSGRSRQIGQYSVAAALLLGASINIPGLISNYTGLWNDFPSVDADPRIISDWRFPQFWTVSRSRLRSKCLSQSQMLPLSVRPACPL